MCAIVQIYVFLTYTSYLCIVVYGAIVLHMLVFYYLLMFSMDTKLKNN